MDDDPHWRPCNFTTAEVVAGENPGTFTLRVAGEAKLSERQPWVKLSPRVYVVQPDYWEIDLLERGDSPFLEGGPFTVSAPLDHCRGTKGVKVVGKSASKEITMRSA